MFSLTGWASAACTEKDLSLEDESLGVIYADDLESDENGTVFSGACFTLGGLDLSTSKISIVGQEFVSEVLQVTGDGVVGTVQELSGNTETRTLQGVKITLTLPSQVLSGVPLAEGTYILEGAATQSGNAWKFERATLTRTDQQEQYVLEKAVLQNGKLTAQVARLRQDLNQLQATEFSGTEKQVQAQHIEFCVCRELDARELLLLGEDLNITPETFSVRSVRFDVYGWQTPDLGTLTLPLDPQKPLLAAVQDAFAAYQERLNQKPIEVVSDATGVALHNLPVSLDLQTRLNLGVHVVDAGFSPEILLDQETADVRIRAGLPAPVGQQAAFPALLVDVEPSQGLALRAHFRTGVNETREFGLGYSLKTGPVSWLALASGANEGQVTALVYAAEGHYQGTGMVGSLNLQTDARVRLQTTLNDVAAVHEGFYQLGYQQGPWTLQLRHTLSGSVGEVHFSAFAPEQRNQTEVSARYAADRWSLKYALSEDWLAQQTRQQVVLALPVVELDNQIRYSTLESRWLNLSLSATAFVQVTDAFRAEPMLGYDWATGNVLYGFGGTLNTPNYAYTLGAYRFAEGWGIKARFGLH
ncbi:hypothetical protein [Deinococcus roseus]|uniref:hypothetical protein n=1 Tax=Deinococcus roseus TaxID=392414 RepID=UPI00188B233A|nr:hypothetical protein [Deinococcus roseus]